MKYWAYVDGRVPGSFTPRELSELPGFGMTTLVCPAEGEIQDRNWKRAGEFDELARELNSRPAGSPPAPPGSAPALAKAAAASDVDSVIDAAGAKLFGHVAALMHELESRREERELSASLQRQLSALKDELRQSREREGLLELRAARAAELDAALERERTAAQAAHDALRSREQGLAELRASAERATAELEDRTRRVRELESDLAIRNGLVEQLSRQLTEKELSLAKSLGVISRLEAQLRALSPAPEAPAPPPAPVPPAPPDVTLLAAELSVAPEAEPALPQIPGLGRRADAPEPPTAGSYTSDEPPQAPPYLEPRPLKPHQALLELVRKLFPGG